MNSSSNATDTKKCQICTKSFNSDRELLEHQNGEHSGNEQGGGRPQNEQVYGDPPLQDEQQPKKIA
jgi:hypothetical protein